MKGISLHQETHPFSVTSRTVANGGGLRHSQPSPTKADRKYYGPSPVR